LKIPAELIHIGTKSINTDRISIKISPSSIEEAATSLVAAPSSIHIRAISNAKPTISIG
jgi:hypothetical protein